MRRGVFDLLRRGFDNALANWQVSLIRFLEGFVFLAIAGVAIVVILVPVLVSIGIEIADLKTPDDIEGVFFTLMTRGMMLLVWVAVAVTVLTLVFLVLHSFVEAGCARVLVDGERLAGPAIDGPRPRYRVFSFELWLTGAKDGWWTLFWIYNLAWGFAGLLMLIPLLPTAGVILLLRGNDEAMAATGCLGLVVSLLFMFVVAVWTGMWSSRAIVEWAVERRGARHSLATAWRAVKTDFGRHFLTAAALFVVAVAVGGFISSLSMFAGLGTLGSDAAVAMIVTLPLRIAGSLLNSAFSAFIGSWFLAAYAALALDPLSSRA